ncbi:MAG: alanine--tRNA ligase [Actinomycetota bacterium]
MKSADIRKTFLDFFAEREHKIVPSSSLIPNDPTLLLSNAGMNQFKPYFLGHQKPGFPRAASVQKCARTTDIENVGLTARHLSFFEMLGNFSFGDYYKDDATKFAWELMTKGFGLEPDRLWVSVYRTDDEAYDAWHKGVGVPKEKIVRRGEEDNFWSMGVAGPCGPCSEIFYDRGPEFGEVNGFEDGDRIMEIWNLVFMQNEQDANGNVIGDLPARNVDTGMGLERLASVLQDVRTNFETDTIAPMVRRAEEITGRKYGADPRSDVSLRILADHARSGTFLIADGVFPSNEDRGYVLRRLLRRAVRHAKILGVDELVLPELVDSVISTLGDAYPELSTNRALVLQQVTGEEESFRSTLSRGLSMLSDSIEEGSVPGDVAFKLHDTFGFPLELTREIAAESGLVVDEEAFKLLMEEQRDRARAHRKKLARSSALEAYRSISSSSGATEFEGYGATELPSTVIGIIDGSGALAEAAKEGDEIEIVLRTTPFYPEGGGQVGDSGTIEFDGGIVTISDTQKVEGDLIVHRGVASEGEMRRGIDALARVDSDRRAAIARSHTATHIIHQTLRELLGEHARQAGSLVDAGRLRFDFPHQQSVPREVLQNAEHVINERVLRDSSVRPYETTQDYARQIGAMALFGEKYGDIVRVVEVGDYSIELCGGTHVARTSQIGGVKILGEASIGANIRRVEALTGETAIEGWRHDRAVLEHIALLLKASPEEAPQKVERLVEELKRAEREIERARKAQQSAAAGDLARAGEKIGDVTLIAIERPGLNVGDLQKLAIATRDAVGGPAICVIASSSDGKAGIVAAVTKDVASRGISARALLKDAAKAVGGGAGGKDEVATGGGNNPAGVAEALRLATIAAREALPGQRTPPEG